MQVHAGGVVKYPNLSFFVHIGDTIATCSVAIVLRTHIKFHLHACYWTIYVQGFVQLFGGAKYRFSGGGGGGGGGQVCVSVCKTCGKLGGVQEHAPLDFGPFTRHNLVEPGTVFTQKEFTMYCVIKAFIIDVHVKYNSQHIQGGASQNQGGGGANAPPCPLLKETLM